MLHYEPGRASNQLSQSFIPEPGVAGVPFDVIGLSYYPFFHGTISAMLQTEWTRWPPLPQADRDRGDQYAWTLATGNSRGATSTATSSGSQPALAVYPAVPAVSSRFVTDELSFLAQAPDGLERGLFYWAPEWIPAWAGSRGAGVGTRTPTSPCSTPGRSNPALHREFTAAREGNAALHDPLATFALAYRG